MSGTNCKTLKENVHKCANGSQYFDQAFTVLKMRLLARLVVPFYTNVHLFSWNNSGDEIHNFYIFCCLKRYTFVLQYRE